MKMNLPILSTVEDAAREGLRAAAKDVLKRSRELSPEGESGRLKKDGRVTVDDLTVQISYKGPKALKQHEELDWIHPGGGQAKFLETAAEEVDVAGPVARAVRAALGG